ncbi:MAG: hypothetical protein GYA60_03830 [Candidatus Methanofastidiosa archaeon]|nr:hypothetical protein [Candidatus Methanofastidiosa archaeon]
MKKLILVILSIVPILFFNSSAFASPFGNNFFYGNEGINSLIIVGESASSQEIIQASKMASLIANYYTEPVEIELKEVYSTKFQNISYGDIITLNPSKSYINGVEYSYGLESLWYSSKDSENNKFDINSTHEEIILRMSDTDIPKDNCLDFNKSGIIYRIVNIPKMSTSSLWNCDYYVELLSGSQKIKLFDDYYYLLYNGDFRNKDGEIKMKYFIYGTRQQSNNVIFKVGDKKQFGWYTVKLLDIQGSQIHETSDGDKYKVKSGGGYSGEYKVYLQVSDFTGKSEEFIMVMDANGSCCTCQPSQCDQNGGDGSFSNTPSERYENDPYVIYEEETRIIDGHKEVVWSFPTFYIDGIKVFEGADISKLAEFNIYSLKDYGAIVQTSCCDSFIDYPNDYNLTILNNREDVITRGVDINYDGNITGTENSISVYESLTEECNCSIKTPFASPVYVNPGKDKKYGTCDDFLDINASHLRYKKCNYDGLELILCDKIELGCCEPLVVFGPNDYFKIDILDSKYKNNDGDGVDLEISQEVLKRTIEYNRTIKIDPMILIKLDNEISQEEKTSKNLILLGNEINNLLIKELYEKNFTNLKWSASFGEWEYIENGPYGNSIVIVGGRDSNSINIAINDFISFSMDYL